MSRHVWTLVLVAALAACGSKKKEEPASTEGSGSATAVVADDANTGSAAGSAAGSADTTADIDVPTEVDFEEQAATDITDKNVEAQVKAIEKDLGK